MLKRSGVFESSLESLNEWLVVDVLSSYDGGSAMLKDMSKKNVRLSTIE
jgi:hypothetical protein